MSDIATAEAATAEAKARTHPCKFIWYELMTTDREAAEAFYADIIGWRITDSGQPGMRYDILNVGDRGVGGVLELTDEMKAGGARPGWIGYIQTPDTDQTAKDISAAGGSVHKQPDDIPNVGRFAMVADPGGAPFYLLTPTARDDVPPPADTTATGVVSWHELVSSAGEAKAFAFYSELFGWETMQEMDMGPMGKYRIFGTEGVQLGGMMDKPENVPVSSWTFYINVDGIDSATERVKAKGGQVIMGPMEVPGGSWIIQGIDPQGAHFALVSARR